MALAPDVDLARLALLVGDQSTGADIKAIATEAGMFAIREERDSVTMLDFERSIRKTVGQKLGGAETLHKDTAFA
jgi:proteasome regulatory subunit